MNAIAASLADPLIRGLYLGFCLTLIVLPMVVLWLWYRRRSQEDNVDQTMLLKVALLTLLWIGLNAAAFGTLMWADGVNQTGG